MCIRDSPFIIRKRKKGIIVDLLNKIYYYVKSEEIYLSDGGMTDELSLIHI